MPVLYLGNDKYCHDHSSFFNNESVFNLAFLEDYTCSKSRRCYAAESWTTLRRGPNAVLEARILRRATHVDSTNVAVLSWTHPAITFPYIGSFSWEHSACIR